MNEPSARERCVRRRACQAAALAIAFVFSHSAMARDFRALDFGQSCAELREREAALGSTAYEGKLPSGYQFAYRARDLEREVLVAYTCKDDAFYRGAYLFEASDGEDATRLYETLKRRVTKHHGAPYYDFASQEYRRKMADLGATLSRADTQVAFWKNDVYEAHASVAEPTQERGWRVSLSYTSLSALEE